MAVYEKARGRGYGNLLLKALEAQATASQRSEGREFYALHWRVVVGEAQTLFGVIRPVRMEQILL